MPELERKTDGPQEGNNSGKLVVELEDGSKKEMGAEDVKNLIAQQASATQKTQQVAAIVEAAKKYGLDPEDYVGHAEGAFSSLTKLVEMGIIDEDGKIIEKKEPQKKDDQTQTTVPVAKDKPNDPNKIASEVLEKLNQRLERLEADQTNLMRANLNRALKAEHDNLNDKDVSEIIATAMKDPRKDVWQHAKDFSEGKVTRRKELRAEIAKEFGINVEEFDANKLKEQNSEGGASAILNGRKLSFRKGKDGVTPKQAMKEFFRKQSGG